MLRTLTLRAKALSPLGDRVLVKKAMMETKTAGGLFIPGDDKPSNEGVVEAVGPGMMTEAGKTIPMNVKVGDNVMLPEYGGMEVKFGDSASEMFLYREHDILGKFS